MKVLVTGSRGFIGSRLIDRLRDHGDEVCELASDCRDPVPLQFTADVVVHLAGIVRPRQRDGSGGEVFDVNVTGTSSVLRYCERTGARMVLASSSAVYGPRSDPRPIKEDEPCSPVSPYATSKWLAEELCRRFSADAGAGTCVLRIFNVYGLAQPEPFLVPYVLGRLRDGQTVRLRSPAAIRDFVHVDDVVSALDKAARHASKDFTVFNVGTGRATRVDELAHLLAKRLGYDDLEIGGAVTASDADAAVADASLLRRQLGWSAEVELEDGLDAMIRVASGGSA